MLSTVVHGLHIHSVRHAALRPVLRPIPCNTRAVILRAADHDQSRLKASEITVLIKHCSTHQQLHELVREQGAAFNFINAAAAFTHAAQLAQQLQETKQSAKPSSSANNSIYQQHRKEQEEFEQQWTWLLHCLPPVLQTVQQHCSSFQGRQVANCLWAAQRLLHILQRWQQQQQQQASKLPDAEPAAEVDSSSSDVAAGAHTPPTAIVSSQQQQLLRALQQPLLLLMHQLVHQAGSCWHLFSGQELVLLLYAVTNMPCMMSPALTAAIENTIDSQLVLNPGTSCALAGTPGVATASQQQQQHDSDSVVLSSHGSRPSNNTAAAAMVVDSKWFNTALRQLQLQQKQGRLRLKPQEFEMLLISLRRWRMQQQQPELQPQQQQQQQLWDPGDTATEPMQQQRRRQQQRGLNNTLLKVAMPLLQQLLLGGIVQRPERCSSRDVCGIVFSFAVLTQPLGSNRGSGSLRRLAATVSDKALRSSCNPVDIANLLYGLAITNVNSGSSSSGSSGALPAGQTVGWWQGLLQGIARQLRSFAAAELVICLYSIAKIFGQRQRMPQQLLSALVTAATAKLQPQQQQELLMLLWAIGALGLKPKAQDVAAILDMYLAGAAAAAAAPGPRQQQQQQGQARDVSIIFWVCGRIGFCPRLKTLNTLLTHSMALLPYTAAENLAHTAYGLGRLGVRPNSEWLARFYMQLRLVGLSGHEAVAEGAEAGFGAGLTEQGLAMIFWGLYRMRVSTQAAATTLEVVAGSDAAGPSIPNAPIVALSLHDVITSSEQLLQASPAAVGVVLWSLVKLGYQPTPQLLQATLQALAAKPQQQQRGRWQQQQEQKDVQVGRRLMQSLSLAAWASVKVETSDVHEQLLRQALRTHTYQLHHANPIDLITILWALKQLQLQPSHSWLLEFYGRSQGLLQTFTDLQLMSIAVLLEKLLLQGQQQQQQAMRPPVPPAVWQLQLELELRHRWRKGAGPKQQSRQQLVRYGAQQQEQQQLSEEHVHTTDRLAQADDAPQQHQQRIKYDPLIAVSAVLRRWRRITESTLTLTSAAEQQDQVQTELGS